MQVIWKIKNGSMGSRTLQAGNLSGREAPARQAQGVPRRVPPTCLHIQAHQRARRHRAPCKGHKSSNIAMFTTARSCL